MTDRANLARELEFAAPRTLSALKHLVMAAAKTANSRGKKTWLGRDKQAIAFGEFEREFQKVLLAMHGDSLITSNTPAPDVADKAEVLVEAFARAYPNWQEGYAFIAYYFTRPEAASQVRDVQEGAYVLDNPALTRS